MIDEGVQSSTWGNGFVLLLLSYYTVSTKTQRTMCLVTYKLTYILPYCRRLVLLVGRQDYSVRVSGGSQL